MEGMNPPCRTRLLKKHLIEQSSDQRWQYRHKQYQQLLQKKMPAEYEPESKLPGNAVIKNFFGLPKSALSYLQEFQYI